MPYDLIIFDLDGTLTDPRLGITRSHQYALAAFGFNEELENLEKFIGPPLRDVYRDYYGMSEADIEKAVIVFREYFAQTGIFENEVYPGISELLQRLKAHGKTLAVATGKAKLYAEKILEYFYLDRYFDYVSGDEMDGSLTKHGKRDIVRMVMEKLDPQRKMKAVMIGDRYHDIEGAHDNEIDGIGVLWGFGSVAELEDADADIIVQSTDELLTVL